jgi:hypothetical protein
MTEERMRWVRSATWAAILGFGFGGSANAIDVTGTAPGAYELNVSRTLSEISVTFDSSPLLTGGLDVRVAGMMSGLHPGTVVVEGSTIRFTNTGRPFLAGELVIVNLHRDIENAVGDGLSGGHYFAFTIETTASNPTWDTREPYNTALRPYFIHGGDLDNDGFVDLAVPNEDSDDVSFFPNVDAGTFPSHFDYDVGNTPSSIVGEDFDNDGFQDLATADIQSSTMSVLINDGGTGFKPADTYAAGSITRQVHAADFDGDNDVDICVTSRNTNEVYLYYNDGTGDFGTGVPYSGVGVGPFAIRTADVDLDGHVDVLVANQDSGTLSVLNNDGDGTFTTSGEWSIGSGPWCLNGNDFDGDGDFDVVSVASFGNRLVLLRNVGGDFPAATQIVTESFPLGVFAGDVEGDGDIDAISSNFSGRSVQIFLNNGSGTLTLDTTLDLPQAGTFTWLADLDVDGDLDLATLDELADLLFIYMNDGTAVTVGPKAVAASISFSAVPNPASAGRSIELRHGAGSGAAVAIFDVRGRLVRRLDRGAESWDGRDAAGHVVAAGRYAAVVVAGETRASAELTVLP